MLILRNNSTKSRKIIEIFAKLYVSRSERFVVCFKFLNPKEIFCLRKNVYTHDCQPWEKLSEIYSLFYNLLPKYIFIN